MRGSRSSALLLCLIAAACGKPASPANAPVAPPIRNGANAAIISPAAASGDPNAWMRFPPSNTPRQIACGERPVLLEGSRTSVTLSGRCGYVRIAGDHNDVDVELAPGGTIEITGEHNDVSWTQPNGAIRPSLYNRGNSNSFHPAPEG